VSRSVLLVKDGLGIGGSELQLLMLARGLVASNHRVAVVNMSAAAALEPAFEAAGAHVTRLVRRSRFDPVPVLQLASYVRCTRPDVVQSFHWLANLYATLGLGLVARARRPAHASALRGHYYSGPKGSARATLDRVLARRVDVAVANCHALIQHAHAHHVRYRRSVVIYNGVRPAAECDSVPVNGEIRFTSLGRLAAVKRQRDVLLAAQQVCAEFPHVCFWFIGDGPDRHALEQLAVELGIGERVRFHGETPDPEALLRQADALVLASTHEGMPNAVLEGMALGLPVVATRVGGVPEAVDHGVNGFLVPHSCPHELAAALKLLAGNAELRRRMGRNALAVAQQRFSDEAMVHSYRELYAWI
jgi:L-malate glycosyltransferase